MSKVLSGRGGPGESNGSSGSAPRASGPSSGRRLWFAPSPPPIAASPRPPALTEAEISDCWYSDAEIEGFLNDAREKVRRQCILPEDEARAGVETSAAFFCAGQEELTEKVTEASPSATGRHSQHKPSGIDEEDECCCRGVEHCISSARVKRRQIVTPTVLGVQRQLKRNHAAMSQEPALVLAFVSRRLTHWAKKVALATGHSDSLEADLVYKESAATGTSALTSFIIRQQQEGFAPQPQKRKMENTFVPCSTKNERGGTDGTRRVRRRIRV